MAGPNPLTSLPVAPVVTAANTAAPADASGAAADAQPFVDPLAAAEAASASRMNDMGASSFQGSGIKEDPTKPTGAAAALVKLFTEGPAAAKHQFLYGDSGKPAGQQQAANPQPAAGQQQPATFQLSAANVPVAP